MPPSATLKPAVVIAIAIAIAACAARPNSHAAPTPPPAAATDSLPPAFEPLALIPHPHSVTLRPGSFPLTPSTRILIAAPESRPIATQLAHWLILPESSISLSPVNVPVPVPALSSSSILLALDPPVSPSPPRARTIPADPSDSAYTLEVTPSRVDIHAHSVTGLFYAAETLTDLAGAPRLPSPAGTAAQRTPTRSIPCAAVADAPRFAFRAMHLDVARHFFDKPTVERYLDLLAFYRFNVFHWHLTDDQGFRFEVKAHPELTAVGGRDGFYTHADMAEIVAYASERGITVVPEIEMPGHARAILAAHPELSCTGTKQEVPRNWGVFDDVLCAGNEATYALIADVLAEVASVFPSRLIHVGGDEVPPMRWSACPKCRALVKSSHVDPGELEAVFMHRVAEILQRLGRRMVVWDEALPSPGSPSASPFRLPADALVIAWQSKDRGRTAANLGYDVVMAPHDQAYFNFQQAHGNVEPGHKGFLPWSKVRVFDPIPDDLDSAKTAKIVGGEGALWTEFVETPADIETLVMPRMAALAEALWTGPSEPEADFVARFGRQLPALDAAGVRYFVDPPDIGRKKTVFLDGAGVSMTKSGLFPTAVLRWTTDGTEPTPGSPIYESPFSVHETTTVAAASFLPSGRSSPVVHSVFEKERPRPSLDLRSPRTGALYTYIEGDFHRVPDFAKAPTAKRRHGEVAQLTLADVGRALGNAMRKEQYAVELDAYVQIPRDGIYRFIAKADDGVRVEVGSELVVEDDSEHGPRESDGQIALAAGFHSLRISFFQAGGGASLALDIEGPGLPRAPVAPFRN